MKRTLLLLGLLLLIGWILADCLITQRRNLRHFDPAEVARLDCAMWRSYYERKPIRLLWQSSELLRKQVHAPFWRSFVIAYYAAKAAFDFKDGKNRTDYNRALPALESFYGAIAQLSSLPIDVPRMARNELEWWIIRRERQQHPPAEWITLQAQIAADLYHIPVVDCHEYARLRTQAMLFRDQKGAAISEADWQQVQADLEQSWRSLATALQ